MDDGLPSCNDPESDVQLANGMMEMLSCGGFYLTKFTSNGKQVLSALPAERRSSPNLNLDLDELPMERALGVQWFVEPDEIGFEIQDLKRPETKHGILSTVCSVYDPLRMAAPMTLSARAMVQDLWKAKVSWDDPLDPQTLQRWNRWKNHYHLFLMGKSRNAPVKFTSIPRLELQAAVLATQVNKVLQEELTLSILKTVYWTDSKIVLHYLKNRNSRFQTYVANRVEEIKESSQVQEWRHVPGVINPTDDASRRLNPSELSPEHCWLQGPKFLWQTEEFWPSAEYPPVPDDQLELRKESNLCAVTVLTQSQSSESQEPVKNKIHQLMDDCSDWSQLRRRIAWLIRFTQFICDRKSVKSGGLLTEYYETATNAIARIVQSQAYGSEISELKAGKHVKSTSKIANLNPVIDDSGMLRINRHIKGACVSYDAKHQVIMPQNHCITSALVRSIHVTIGHLGCEHVISKLRQGFWIPQIRVLVRSVLGQCIKCKKINAKPMSRLSLRLTFEPGYIGSFSSMKL